ncbi:MAG: hypothetical protein PF501_18205 [Salinisphaera sp.]|jgi:predicted DsbA family dithiol-disulfide isomerase|nr:hypothetical protein [Salinisphaera sp.]
MSSARGPAIGYARLNEAMQTLKGELAFDIHWHPFVLNPDLPAEGRDMVEHLGAKYGKNPDEVAVSQGSTPFS